MQDFHDGDAGEMKCQPCEYPYSREPAAHKTGHPSCDGAKAEAEALDTDAFYF